MIHNTKYKLTIGWLYPELMNTYGDRGNIIALTKRCEWRDIDVEIKCLDLGFRISDLQKCDLLFMGGAQDKQQKIVSQDFTKEKTKALQEMIEDETPGLYICGAYQFLGKYYKEANGTIIPGLHILDLYTENPGENHERLIGNIVVNIDYLPFTIYHSKNENHQSSIINRKSPTLVGFENHGGRTYLGKGIEPLGKVVKGFGNNGNQPRLDGGQAGDTTEGAIYKNSFGTYLHGPILPKNPHFADYLIQKSLEKKYLPHGKADKKEIELNPLDDTLEQEAHETILKKLDNQ